MERKVIVETFSDDLTPFSLNGDYAEFHSTVGTVLGNIAGENGGLEGINATFDDGTNIDTERKELAAAAFWIETKDSAGNDNLDLVATVTLVEE